MVKSARACKRPRQGNMSVTNGPEQQAPLTEFTNAERENTQKKDRTSVATWSNPSSVGTTSRAAKNAHGEALTPNKAPLHTYLVRGRANAHGIDVWVLQHLVIVSVRLAAVIEGAPLRQLPAAGRDADEQRILQTERDVGGVHLPNTSSANHPNAEDALGGIGLDRGKDVLNGNVRLLHPQGGTAGAGRLRRSRRHSRAVEGAGRQAGGAGSLQGRKKGTALYRTERKASSGSERRISSAASVMLGARQEKEPRQAGLRSPARTSVGSGRTTARHTSGLTHTCKDNPIAHAYRRCDSDGERVVAA